MWRAFTAWGAGLLVVGVIVAVAAGARTFDIYSGASAGAAVVSALGIIVAAVGGMLLNAGLIGAAVGIDPQSLANLRTGVVASRPPAADDSGIDLPELTHAYRGPGAQFRSVDGSSVVFVADDMSHFMTATRGSTGVKQRTYDRRRLVSILLTENYKTITQAETADEVASSLQAATMRVAPEIGSNLGVVLILDDPAHPRETVWFHHHRDANVQTGSWKYDEFWREAARCFEVIGGLLPVGTSDAQTAQTQTELPVADAAPNANTTCIRCGEQVATGDRFCGNCGAPMG
jgi:hypothetical protein